MTYFYSYSLHNDFAAAEKNAMIELNWIDHVRGFSASHVVSQASSKLAVLLAPKTEAELPISNKPGA